MDKRLHFEEHERISGFLQSLTRDDIKNLGLRLGLCDVNLKEFPGDMVKAWLSMKDEDREQTQVKEPTLNALLLALQDIGCSDVIAQIQAEARGGDTECGTVEDQDDPNLTKVATSAKEISELPTGVPKLSSDIVQEFKKGFDCEFEDKTAMERFHLKCSICSLILREPCTADCCGARFCQNCIQKEQLEGGSTHNCPLCRRAKFNFMPDKSLKENLLKSKVYCKNQKIGCEWIGELSKLDEHLNLNPSESKYFEGCQFVEVSCPSSSCSELKQKQFRGDVFMHYNEMHGSSESITSSELNLVIKECKKKFERRFEDLEKKIRDREEYQLADSMKRQEEQIERSLEEKWQLELIKQQSDREQWRLEFEQQLKDEHLNELKSHLTKWKVDIEKHTEELEDTIRRRQLEDSEKIDEKMKGCLMDLEQKLSKKFQEEMQANLKKHTEEIEQMQKLLMELKQTMSEYEEKQTDSNVHADELEESIMRSLKEKTETDLAKANEYIQNSLDELKQNDKRMSECEVKQKDLKVHTGKVEDSLKEKLQTESAENGREMQRSLSELKESIERRMSECERNLNMLNRNLKAVEKKDMRSLEEAESNQEMPSELKETSEKKRSECEGKQTDLKVHTDKVEKEKMELQHHKRGLDKQLKKKTLDDLKSKNFKRELDDMYLYFQRQLTELEERTIKRSHEFDEIKKLMQKLEQCSHEHEKTLNEHQSQLKQKSSEFEVVKKIMRNEIHKTEAWINQRIGQPIGPVILEMHNYRHYRERGGDWFSSAFYTHRCGYKMCLNVFAKGSGKGADSHVSVYLYLMKGEFDTMLTWPFHGKITIKLVNRGREIRHYTAKAIPFSDKIAAATKQVPVDKERNSTGCGVETFISHEDVRKYYEKNDSLQFEITKVIID